jgi:sirohydrochlorin ferrochelatase
MTFIEQCKADYAEAEKNGDKIRMAYLEALAKSYVKVVKAIRETGVTNK